MLKCELRKIRSDEYKMDVGSFARYLDVNFATYQGWEQENSRPNLKVAIKIAKKLNRQVEDIWHE